MIDLSIEYQRKILALMLRSPKHAFRIARMLRPEWIDDPVIAEAVAAAGEYIQRYNVVPTKLVMREEAGDAVVDSATYKKCLEVKTTDADYVVDRLAEFCRYQACKHAVLASAEVLQKQQVPESMVDKLAEALRVGDDVGFMGERLSNVEARKEAYLNPTSMLGLIPTGWRHVDEVLGGGLGRGELGVILGATNRGKSQLLANIAVNLYMQAYGYKVVYVSLEMRMQRLLTRLDRRLYGPKHADDLAQSPDAYVRKLAQRHKMLRHPEGEVVVNFWPDNSLSVEQLAHYLKTLRDEHRYDFDVLIVDYAQLLRRNQRTEVREHLATMASSLRALGEEFNAAVWTVAQTNRAALSKKIINLDDIGESYELTHKADVVMALCMTDAERAENRGRLFFAKMREGGAYKTVPFSSDFSRAYIETESVLLPEITETKVSDRRERQVDEAMARVAAQRKRPS